MENKSIESLHEDHHEWLQEVTNWNNELIYYSRVLLRLVDGIKLGPDTEKMEEFQSRFDSMQEEFDRMAKNITAHDKSLADTQSDHKLQQHQDMDKQIRAFKAKFNELKNEFYKFEEKFIYE